MSKYKRYQDYVIKDGSLIGEFEEMYKDFNDPWEQMTEESNSPGKKLALNSIQFLKSKRIIELGCGLGDFANSIQKLSNTEVLGIDISSTAIEKATKRFPNCKFATGNILDFELIESFNPDTIVMAEITWYILEDLRKFLDHLKGHLPEVHLIHLLCTYPEGQQKYGTDYFTNLKEILSYFDMNYIEYGEVTLPKKGGVKSTYFCGKYSN